MKHFIYLYAFFSAINGIAQSNLELVPYKVDSLFGYYNIKENKVTIEPQFDDAFPFHQYDVTFVKKGKSYFIINKNGKLLLNVGDSIPSDLYWYDEMDLDELSWPFVIMDTDLKISKDAHYFSPFSLTYHDWFIFEFNDTLKKIDLDGNVIDTYIIFKQNGFYGLKKNKEIIIEPIYKRAHIENNVKEIHFYKYNNVKKRFILYDDNKKTVPVIRKNRQPLKVPPNITISNSFQKKQLNKKNKYKCDLIIDGDTIMKESLIYPILTHSLIACKNDSTYSIINYNLDSLFIGMPIFNYPIFSEVIPYTNFITVLSSGKRIILYPNGKRKPQKYNFIAKLPYNYYNPSFIRAMPYSKRFYTLVIPKCKYFMAYRDNYYFILDSIGNEVFSGEKLVHYSNNDLILSQNNSKWGVFTMDGKQIFDYKFDNEPYFLDSISRVSVNNEIYYISMDGKEFKE